jgi:O-glycosyl hydrolase
MYKSHRLLLIFGLLLCSIVIVCLVESCLVPPRASGTTVDAWLTTSDGSNHLTRQGNLNFASDSQTADSSTIDVNEYQQFQQMDGFGAAVTDSSAWLISTKMSTT